MVVVLHLCFGQSSLVGGAPVDRFQAPVDAARPDEFGKLSQDDCFVVIVHGCIRMFPIPQHPEALELVSLHVDKAGRVLSAKPPLLQYADRLRPVPQFLVDLELDG